MIATFVSLVNKMGCTFFTWARQLLLLVKSVEQYLKYCFDFYVYISFRATCMYKVLDPSYIHVVLQALVAQESFSTLVTVTGQITIICMLGFYVPF